MRPSRRYSGFVGYRSIIAVTVTVTVIVIIAIAIAVSGLVGRAKGLVCCDEAATERGQGNVSVAIFGDRILKAPAVMSDLCSVVHRFSSSTSSQQQPASRAATARGLVCARCTFNQGELLAASHGIAAAPCPELRASCSMLPCAPQAGLHGVLVARTGWRLSAILCSVHRRG